MIIGDVGEGTTEEVNIGAPGANYGWPTCEGTCSTPGMTNPIYSYPHGNHDASITGGFVYHGSQFPADYQGDFFFADYAQNWIKRLEFNASGGLSAVRNFVPPDGSLDGPYGDIVALQQGPDGSLWYVDTGPFENDNAGAIRRVRNVNTNQPPSAVASANPTSGPAPLTVSFSSAGSTDFEGGAITYRWDFGDGATSTQANPSHTYASSGRYTARLTTSDGTLESVSDPLTITAGGPPVPRILTPADGSTFKAGDVISFSGDATDPEDGALAASRLSWKIVFHHDTHIHPVLDGFVGSSGSVTIPTTGHSFKGNTSYEIVLTATDSDGIQASQVGDDQPAEGQPHVRQRAVGSDRDGRRRAEHDAVHGRRDRRLPVRDRHPVATVGQRVLIVVGRWREGPYRHGPEHRLDAHRDVHGGTEHRPGRRVQLRRGERGHAGRRVGQESPRHDQRPDLERAQARAAVRCRSTASTTSSRSPTPTIST